MLREWATMARRRMMAIDAAMLIVAFLVASIIRSTAIDAEPSTRLLGNHLWLLWVCLPLWLLALESAGFYDSMEYHSRLTLLRRLAAAHAGAGITLLGALFVTHSWGVSRLLVQLFLVLAFLALAAEKVAIFAAQRRAQMAGRGSRNLLVVGSNGLSSYYVTLLSQHPYRGFRIIGCLTEGSMAAKDQNGHRNGQNGRHNGQGNGRHNGYHNGHPADPHARRGIGAAPTDDTPPVLGSLDDLRDVLVSYPVDEVAFALPAASTPRLGRALETCAEKGVTARIVVDVPVIHNRHTSVEMLRDLPVLSFEATPPPGLAIAAKRIVDVAGALVGLVAFGVVYCLYGPRIRRESAGSVLFKQMRVGQNGRRFVVYKFRTMAKDAERQQARFSAANEMRGPIFKMRHDPRITPLGKQLRARYLDELPQFWNVLRGEMSLVGTRPPTLEEVARYDLVHHGRLAWKPGLTGMWQVNGNSTVENFEDVVRLDRDYIQNWSLGLDLKILARTVSKVLRGDGW